MLQAYHTVPTECTLIGTLAALEWCLRQARFSFSSFCAKACFKNALKCELKRAIVRDQNYQNLPILLFSINWFRPNI